MPMSKKTYEAVAKVLNEALEEADRNNDHTTRVAVVRLTDRFVQVFTEDNGNFDRSRFIKAVVAPEVVKQADPEGQQHVTVLCRINVCKQPAVYEGPLVGGKGQWTQTCEKHRWRILVKDRRPAPGVGVR